MTRYSTKEISENKLRLHYSNLSKLDIRFSHDFNLATCLNLALLSQMTYWDDPRQFGDGLRAVFDESKRVFKVNRDLIKNPFLAVSPSTIHRNFLPVDTAPDLKSAIIDSNTQLALFTDDLNTYIIFRGTEGFSIPNGLRDWVTNASAAEVDFKKGKGQVHYGFYHAFLSVLPEIEKYLKDEDRLSKPVVLAGHSLGGALATITAAHIRQNLSDRVMLYTYGSPRAGDSDFVRTYTTEKKIHAWRVYHICDPALLFPAEGMDVHLALVPLAFAGQLNAGVLAAALTDFDGKPYTHFGTPVTLQKLQENRAAIMVGPRELPPFELFLKQPVSWRLFAQKDLLELLAETTVEAHKMPLYCSMLRSVMHDYCKSFLEAENQEPDQTFSARTHAELARLTERENFLIEESYLKTGIAPSDATGDRALPGKAMTQPQQKLCYDRLFKAIHLRKSELQSAMLSRPDARYLAKTIVNRDVDGYLHREITYHATTVSDDPI